MLNDSSSTSVDLHKPTTVPWRTAPAIFYVLLVFYGSQIIGGVLLYLYPLTQGWSSARTSAWLTNSVSAQFAYILFVEALSIGAVYWFLRLYKVGFPTIGFNRPRLKYLAYGLAAVLPYYLLYGATVGVASNLISGLNVDQKQQIGFDSVQGTAQLVMTFISLVVLPPLAEEIMVRGFLYSSLKKAMKMRYAVVVTSLIFAAAHLPEGGAAGPLYIAALDTFVLSLVLIYLREKTGSLWPCITLHAIKNGIAFTALFVLHAR
jgi:membrane protease YdiL (CAAX protease family)